MIDEALYTPVRLNNLLEEIAPRFFLPAEFPEKQPDLHVLDRLYKVADMTGKALENYAATLKSREIESLILILPTADDRAKACILRILDARANRRLLELYWPFFQYHFEDDNVLEGAKILLGRLPDKDRSAQQYKNLALFTEGNGFSSLLEKLNSDRVALGLFIVKEQLLAESPLTIRMTELYFYQCQKEGFLLNEKRLLSIFGMTEPDSAKKILINYLTCLDRTEYLFDVNSYIQGRWGEPTQSADWSDVPAALRRKFTDWISYRRLYTHFSQNQLKLKILNDYIPYILHIRLRHDGRYMAADFGDFVIVDDNELSSYSYLLKKSLYEEISESLEKFSVEYIKLTRSRITAARDYIIEEAEDTFMQLEYEDLGRLYIRDMLNIILNLAPDLRPSKSLVRKKRKKNMSM